MHISYFQSRGEGTCTNSFPIDLNANILARNIQYTFPANKGAVVIKV